jgi:hypothetical protein
MEQGGPMKRKTLNASRLQDEVSRRIHRIHTIVEDGVKIRVPRPQLQEPDKTGCNWTMKHFGNVAGFERDVAAVLDEVQAEYNLSEETTSGAAADDPFGDFPGR